MTKTAPFLGIDFGTSQSSMAWFNPRASQAEVIRNAEGEDKTPSVVYYGDGETLVGKAAEDLLENEHERGRILFSVKRHLAKRMRYSLRDRHIRPMEVVAEILRKLKRDAEEGHFRETVSHAVITHPAVFDQVENDLLAEAACAAGFDDVVLLPEPVAAAIAYAESGLNVGDYVLVYDLGGGTFDLALLNRGDADDPFSLVAEPRGLRCGGDDFDLALYDHCDAIAQETLGRAIGKKDRRDLHFLRECRRRKENLSARTRSEFSSYLRGGVQFKHAIDRESFEKLIGPALQPTVSLTRTMLDEATSEGRRPDSIVLIGGSSQVPLVQRLLREALPIEPVKWKDRDLAVALGAAYHARRLWGDRRNVKANRAREESKNQIENLLRWKAANEPTRWISSQNGRWNHEQWLQLLMSLKSSQYWPMDPDAVGKLLENEKQAYDSRQRLEAERARDEAERRHAEQRVREDAARRVRANLGLIAQLREDAADIQALAAEVERVSVRLNPVNLQIYRFLEFINQITEQTERQEIACLVEQAMQQVDLTNAARMLDEGIDHISFIGPELITRYASSLAAVWPDSTRFVRHCWLDDSAKEAEILRQQLRRAGRTHRQDLVMIENHYRQLQEFQPRFHAIMTRSSAWDYVLGIGAGLLGGALGVIGATIWDNWRSKSDSEFVDLFEKAVDEFSRATLSFTEKTEQEIESVMTAFLETFHEFTQVTFSGLESIAHSKDIEAIYHQLHGVLFEEDVGDEGKQFIELVLSNLRDRKISPHSEANIREMLGIQ